MPNKFKNDNNLKFKMFEEDEDNLITKSKDFMEILRKSKQIAIISKEDPSFYIRPHDDKCLTILNSDRSPKFQKNSLIDINKKTYTENKLNQNDTFCD